MQDRTAKIILNALTAADEPLTIWQLRHKLESHGKSITDASIRRAIARLRERGIDIVTRQAVAAGYSLPLGQSRSTLAAIVRASQERS